VATTLQQVLDAIESNDVPGVLAHLSPQAGDVRTDAETLMPRLQIERANSAGEVVITLDDEQDPTQATAEFKGLIVATDKSSGMRGGYNDGVKVVLSGPATAGWCGSAFPNGTGAARRRNCDAVRRRPS
jgi:hypothetical protein